MAVGNDIGVGILSYNRLHCIKRLLQSIYQHTDLNKVKVFVSDESTNQNVIDWLKSQDKITVFTNQPRCGIARNTNRLLKHLKEFKYSYLLNDDVVVLKDNWVNFYIKAHTDLNRYHHFCYRQPGIYGARDSDGKSNSIGAYNIRTIQSKPHGAVLFFTQSAFNKVGYFDEKFGIYGCEHVDWSNRISKSGIQPIGYHDIQGSNAYFSICNEPSSDANKSQHLSKAREYLNLVSSDNNRIYIQLPTGI